MQILNHHSFLKKNIIYDFCQVLTWKYLPSSKRITGSTHCLGNKQDFDISSEGYLSEVSGGLDVGPLLKTLKSCF